METKTILLNGKQVEVVSEQLVSREYEVMVNGKKEYRKYSYIAVTVRGDDGDTEESSQRREPLQSETHGARRKADKKPHKRAQQLPETSPLFE